MKAVSDLDDLGQGAVRGVSVLAAAIAADHLDARMIDQPGRESGAAAVGKEIDDLTT